VSEQTAKPYLVRALHEWCVAHGYTPHLVVSVSSKTRVPMAYVRDGQITFNVSDTAVHRLTMDNEWVLFNARFDGTSHEVAVPMASVVGIYARETGYGMGFTLPEPQEVHALEAAHDSVATSTAPTETANSTDANTALDGKTDENGAPNSTPTDDTEPPKPTRSRAHLSVVK
jgi:stringent starvation protein B